MLNLRRAFLLSLFFSFACFFFVQGASLGGVKNDAGKFLGKGVIFNEILPSPEGPDAQNEWIEIYNKNNFPVELYGWQIRDKKGRTRVYSFPRGTKIPPLSYLVLKRPETKIVLNNDGDGLEMINQNKEVVDSVNFNKALFGQSYNFFLGAGWRWSKVLTPGSKNIEHLGKTGDGNKKLISKKQAKTDKGQYHQQRQEQTAFVGGKVRVEGGDSDSCDEKTSFGVVFLALLLALASALIILGLRVLLKEDRR
ncbi:MAG TPA: lamin tail domain-containing protein [Candidatus Parcubacteria bacterium]|nr:lamin tail domain-containing protein [Candidatus Parcubacteria bacterium]